MALLIDSGWEFVTSEGLNYGVSKVALSHGNLFVAPKNTSDPDPYGKSRDNPYKLSFFSVGGSYGVSSVPINVDGATTEMFSAGVIYANPLRTSGENLTIHDLTGKCLVYSVSGVAGGGRSFTVMFIGVGLAILGTVLATIASAAGGPAAIAAVAALTPAAIISSCKASVFFMGISFGTPAPSAGATVQVGNISLGSNLVHDALNNMIKETQKTLNKIN
jgi:hypothetical protein